jgi:hypothetical protein
MFHHGRRTTARRLTPRAWAAILAMLTACAALIAWQLPAAALDVTGTPTPVTGNATWFTGLGSPYGGCGLPQANLDSQNFLALNVQNSPGNYTNVPRPISSANAALIGMFDNGLNCGRWVKVSIGDYCTGVNDGAPNMAFCRNGSWTSDKYNGATLDMIVADSCDDGNAWCKDDPYHVDLAQASLNQFVLNGSAVGDMYPNHWNNRHVSWQFEAAPGYTGDIQIGAIQGSQPYWGAFAFSHLPNGIHGVQYFSNGTWQTASMDSDQGNDYILAPTTAGGTTFEAQVIDASGNPLNNGRVYTFSLPSSCSTGCSAPYTQLSYTTSTGGGTTTPPTTGTTTTAPPSSGTCSVTSSVVTSWSGGYQVQFTVTNTGTAPIAGWTVTFTLPSGTSIASSWNAVLTVTGQQVTATNASYNGTLAAGASTTWGAVINGSPPPPSPAVCSGG